MRQKILWLLLLSAVLPACLCGLPTTILRPEPPTERVMVTEPPAPTETPLPTEPPVPTKAPLLKPTLVRLHRSGGNLTEQLRAEVQQAAARGQRPFVEFDAEW